jgi:hypothetical protein
MNGTIQAMIRQMTSRPIVFTDDKGSYQAGEQSVCHCGNDEFIAFVIDGRPNIQCTHCGKRYSFDEKIVDYWLDLLNTKEMKQ